MRVSGIYDVGSVWVLTFRRRLSFVFSRSNSLWWEMNESCFPLK